jgi:hypothetical protein
MHLTAKQSTLINTSAYTHNYITQYNKDLHGDADHADYYTQLFEADTAVLQRSTANDVGGLIIYMQGKQLVAYYDYENLGGCVFA